ncbi:dihydropteroate synthase [Rickettsiella endosymbiont of Miltochrista miniata]|uniref:dihydropteroate synthase n=1 Tax=Rickettsiella endosymbiont of Miltochrista miniata TaxID=3066239 RepID=UPI00313CC402
MLILSLGTNLGDSLNNLRLGLQLLQKSQKIAPLQISPLYSSSALLPAYAPVAWNKPFLNLAVVCETELSPLEVLKLIKQIERQLGREESQRWAPRVIDIDILAWDNCVIDQIGLKIPHAELLSRPFALWPLLDLWPDWQHPTAEFADILQRWGSRYTGELAPCGTKQLPHRLEGSALVGILNITPDSFSDGGKFITVPNALAQAEKLVREGAEVLDIGAESTRPGATPVLPETEWALLEPVLIALKEQCKQWAFKPKLSIDTRHHSVAEKAMQLDIDWINDVSGFVDPNMRALAAGSSVKCVVMHNLGVPAQKNVVLAAYPNIFEQILNWTEQRFDELLDVGVDASQLIFDVGIGFGKTSQQSIFLLKNIKQFRRLNCPLLVGHSRKSFLNLITEKPFPDRDFETAMVSYQLAAQGVDYLRVHNVGLNAEAIAMARQLISAEELVTA